jgi:hypothetical protein
MDHFIEMFPKKDGVNALMSLGAVSLANAENEKKWRSRSVSKRRKRAAVSRIVTAKLGAAAAIVADAWALAGGLEIDFDAVDPENEETFCCSFDPIQGFAVGTYVDIGKNMYQPGLKALKAFSGTARVARTAGTFHDFRVVAGVDIISSPHLGPEFNLASIDYVSGNHDGATTRFDGEDENGAMLYTTTVTGLRTDNPQAIALNYNGIYALRIHVEVEGTRSPFALKDQGDIDFKFWHGVSNIRYTLVEPPP